MGKGTVVTVGVVVVGILALGGIGLGHGFGLGAENGEAQGNSSAVVESAIVQNNHEVVIKVENSDIWVNGEPCRDVEELKDRISKLDAESEEKTYLFEHEYAIKETYDEVKKALSDLEETLEITITDQVQ